MLSVPVHKDIGEYEPKIIGKMTARTLICVLGALGLSVIAGLYMYFVIRAVRHVLVPAQLLAHDTLLPPDDV